MRVEFPFPPQNYTDLLKKKDLKEVSVEFEAILLKQILKEAFGSFLKNKSFEQRIYYDTFIEKLAEHIARAGGIGISEYIVNSVEGEQNTKEKLRSMVREKLRKYELPVWLDVIPEVESGYNPEAVSPKGAVGLWQLMKETARAFGLKVEGNIDERKDPEKSTEAALRYIKYLYDKFKDWFLVFVAYNWGETNLRRHLEENGGKLVIEKLPQETRAYLERIKSRLYDRYRYSQK